MPVFPESQTQEDSQIQSQDSTITQVDVPTVPDKIKKTGIAVYDPSPEEALQAISTNVLFLQTFHEREARREADFHVMEREMVQTLQIEVNRHLEELGEKDIQINVLKQRLESQEVELAQLRRDIKSARDAAELSKEEWVKMKSVVTEVKMAVADA